jgi:hypothetical protein
VVVPELALRQDREAARRCVRHRGAV